MKGAMLPGAGLDIGSLRQDADRGRDGEDEDSRRGHEEFQLRDRSALISARLARACVTAITGGRKMLPRKAAVRANGRSKRRRGRAARYCAALLSADWAFLARSASSRPATPPRFWITEANSERWVTARLTPSTTMSTMAKLLPAGRRCQSTWASS